MFIRLDLIYRFEKFDVAELEIESSSKNDKLFTSKLEPARNFHPVCTQKNGFF